ncbi:ABC transporter permease [Nesterenkonia sp. MY13]|uniref:ABC transporter permease n=1 Tax=Nesterenkonia sedimenti TaxID=1463632 RepID=A0A7X8TLD1_9MICC|nr:ABC transporter permease [Nesterenkonia sedimenti]NLS10487.1 ABC transporter permease [Nesterenkonia sedimenti]
MATFILRRLLTGLVTLLIASFLVYFATAALPGDVAQQLLGQDATEEAVAAMREELGIEQSVWLGYLSWLGGIITGDFGTSLVSQEPVSEIVFGAFGNTLLIAVPAILIGVVLSVLLGVIAAVRRGRAADSGISVGTLVAMSIPEFVIATLLVLIFAIALPVFPAVVLSGSEATLGELLPAIWLPIITLVLAMAAYIVRATRSSTIDMMAGEFARTAELKGLRRRQVLTRHVVPNALLPVLPVIAINIAWLMGGVVVVESIFNYPGMGALMIESVSTRDLPVLQAIAIITAVVYVLANLAADLLSMIIDPRQRRTSGTVSAKTTEEAA